MRKILGLISAVAAMGLVASSAFADTSASSVKRVAVNVAQSVGIGQLALAANPDIQTGTVKLTIPFRVDANTQYVDMSVCATNLFKADVPTSPYVIPLDDVVVPTLLSPGHDFTPDVQNMPLTVVTPLVILINGNNWTFRCSSAARFHSPDNNAFSKNVNMTANWNNTNFELPVGEYSGYVRLTVFTVPPGA